MKRKSMVTVPAKRGPKPNAERRAQVVRMRDSGMILAEIGAALVPPVSLQRVAQMLEQAKKRNC